MSIEELLSELNKFWNASEDPRFKGEHPQCDVIHQKLFDAFSDLDNDKLVEILKNLNDDQLEQIATVLEDMVDDRPAVEEFIWL